MSRSFDKIDDVIDCGSGSSLDNLGPLTYILSVNPLSAGENNVGRFLDKANILFTIRTGAVPTSTLALLFEVVGSTTLDRLTLDDFVILNEWHSYAVTWTGSMTDATTVKMYRDEVEASSYAVTANGATRTSDAASSQLIGANAAGSATTDGLIAYVHIFNRVLDINEMRQIRRFPGSITRGLVGFWPFWGGSPEPDYSGNKNNGTVTGALLSTNNPPINGVFQVPRPELSYAF